MSRWRLTFCLLPFAAPLGMVPVVSAVLMAFLVLAGCATQTPTPASAPAPAPPPEVIQVPVAAPEPPTPPALPALVPTHPVTPPEPAAAKEPPPIELPNYARGGKRLPADGGAPGRAVLVYCKSFEIDRTPLAYFNRMQRENRLPSEAEIAERNQKLELTLTALQHVARDWALRRDNNKSVPQKCKVLGGSVEGALAHVVFEADLNGRRQRGTATVLQSAGKWRLRDHGDWKVLR